MKGSHMACSCMPRHQSQSLAGGLRQMKPGGRKLAAQRTARDLPSRAPDVGGAAVPALFDDLGRHPVGRALHAVRSRRCAGGAHGCRGERAQGAQVASTLGPVHMLMQGRDTVQDVAGSTGAVRTKGGQVPDLLGGPKVRQLDQPGVVHQDVGALGNKGEQKGGQKRGKGLTWVLHCAPGHACRFEACPAWPVSHHATHTLCPAFPRGTLMSRCMMPFVCRYSSPSKICLVYTLMTLSRKQPTPTDRRGGCEAGCRTGVWGSMRK